MESLDINRLQKFQTQKYLVIATKWLDPDEVKHLLDYSFGAAWSFGIIEINCLIYDTNSTWSLITYYPYDNEDCTTFTYKTIETFTSTNYSKLANIPIKTLYYPKKVSNLRKCPINIAVFPCQPYVFTKTVNGETKFFGIEIQILEAIASSLNFTPNFILPHDVNAKFSFGDTKDNCYKMVSFPWLT